MRTFADFCIEELTDSQQGIADHVATSLEFNKLFEREVLIKAKTPIVVAIDSVDRLLGTEWQDDFFGMLRDWHNRRWLPGWSTLDLALVIATEPYILLASEFQSPFNVGEIVELGNFTRGELSKLNASYGSPLDDAECDDMFALLCGHPYLSRIALHYLATHPDRSWEQVAAVAATDKGPFIDHLKALLLLLRHKSCSV